MDLVVAKIGDEHAAVRRHFATDNIYYVGTSEGCGCKFGLDPELFDENDEEERKENEKYVAETNKLIDIILDKVDKKQRVEMYCCWADEYEKEVTETETILTTKRNLRDDFEIKERKFVRFE